MTATATVDTKAKNLETMRAVTQMLKDEQRAPKRMTKEVPAAKLLKEVGVKVKKETKHGPHAVLHRLLAATPSCSCPC